MTKISILKENGEIEFVALYFLEPKQALICYIMQYLKNDHNSWTYHKEIDGIKESPTVKNHYYFEDQKNNIVLFSYPYK